jgi:hypothetical protein
MKNEKQLRLEYLINEVFKQYFKQQKNQLEYVYFEEPMQNILEELYNAKYDEIKYEHIQAINYLEYENREKDEIINKEIILQLLDYNEPIYYTLRIINNLTNGSFYGYMFYADL